MPLVKIYILGNQSEALLSRKWATQLAENPFAKYMQALTKT